MNKEQKNDLARYAILSGAYMALASIAGFGLLEAAFAPAVTAGILAHGLMFVVLLGGSWWAFGELIDAALRAKGKRPARD